MGVMRGRKHRHQWGMSCHYLSQHRATSFRKPGLLRLPQTTRPAASLSARVCYSPLMPLSTFPRTKLITDNPISQMQKLRLKAVTHEAQSVEPQAPKHRRSKLHPLLTPNYREKRLHEVFSVPTAPHGQHHTDLSAYGRHQLNINP